MRVVLLRHTPGRPRSCCSKAGSRSAQPLADLIAARSCCVKIPALLTAVKTASLCPSDQPRTLQAMRAANSVIRDSACKNCASLRVLNKSGQLMSLSVGVARVSAPL